jgi:hypothetical protein
MKKYIPLLVLLISVSAAFAGKGLTVTQRYTTAVGGQNVSVTWYVSGNKCKMKMLFSDKDVNTTTYFIPDLAAGKMLSYSDAAVPAGTSKAYFTLPVQSIRGKNAVVLTVEKTGEVKEIAGVKCEKVVAKTANTITEMWVTKDFDADYFKFAPFFKNSYELSALSQGNIKGFPVQSVTKDASGTIISSYEALSVTTTDIADTEFAVPAEYKSAEEISKAKK